ncbi:hypothetical protein [Mycobacteroides saopaulense]|uniref:hypothetical protein n=1 Tax=Mycobacteroides saopaulense TaxID=1578165 RepID=UPI000B4C24B1|nr:hypothetical protein [Mycobacteroides saopaulense]
MKRAWTIAMAGLAILVAVSCNPGADSEQGGNKIMEPTPVKMSEALRVTTENLAFVTAEKVEPGVNDVERMGCRTSYNSALPEGPPWWLRLQRDFTNPTPELIAAVLERLESLSSKGFHRQESKRPEPEPVNSRTYRDGAGYIVSAREDVRGNGIHVYVVTSSSPCADED